MKEMTYLEQMFHNLNAAFSVNYLVLQNLELLKQSKMNPEAATTSIFSMLTGVQFDEDYFSTNFDKFAEVRNDFFSEIRKFLRVKEFSYQFQNNGECLIESYNHYFKKNIAYSDVFGDRDISDWDKFTKICEDISALEDVSGFESLSQMLLLSQFLQFYNDHKQWISILEIFETLEQDISSYGNKSLYFGIPSNPNVLKIKYDDFQKYSSAILNFASSKLSEIKKLFKNIKNLNPEDVSKLESEHFILNAFEPFLKKIEERFKLANTNTMELGKFWSKVRYQLTPYTDKSFRVDEVYIHKYEVMDLISLLSFFPELSDIFEEISLKYLNDTQTQMHGKINENS